jgi:hypothetical protein
MLSRISRLFFLGGRLAIRADQPLRRIWYKLLAAFLAKLAPGVFPSGYPGGSAGVLIPRGVGFLILGVEENSGHEAS